MKCVFEDNRLPNGFEEQFDFSAQMPYTISIKRFPEEDVVPLHYAQTIEILFCEQLGGHVVIDNQAFLLHGRQLFVIPPYTVHANTIVPGSGVMYVLKISIDEISQYLNLQQYLSLFGCQIGQLSYVCPEYDDVKGILHNLIEKDGELADCLQLILKLFSLLAKHADPERSIASPNARLKSSSLQELISWTQTHYAEKITIEQAAALSGYSKYHFCTRFKSLTGMTYLEYLSSVRMTHACLMLKDGQPISRVCRECGYETVSYFSQLFRRAKGMTPGQYAAQARRASITHAR